MGLCVCRSPQVSWGRCCDGLSSTCSLKSIIATTSPCTSPRKLVRRRIRLGCGLSQAAGFGSKRVRSGRCILGCPQLPRAPFIAASAPLQPGVPRRTRPRPILTSTLRPSLAPVRPHACACPLSPLRGFVIGSCCADFFTCVRLRRAWLCDSAGAPMVGRVYNGALRPTDSGSVSVHPECKGKLASSEAGEGESDASGATAQGGGGVFRSGSTSRASSPTSLGPSGDAAAGYADFLPS